MTVEHLEEQVAAVLAEMEAELSKQMACIMDFTAGAVAVDMVETAEMHMVMVAVVAVVMEHVAVIVMEV